MTPLDVLLLLCREYICVFMIGGVRCIRRTLCGCSSGCPSAASCTNPPQALCYPSPLQQSQSGRSHDPRPLSRGIVFSFLSTYPCPRGAVRRLSLVQFKVLICWYHRNRFYVDS